MGARLLSHFVAVVQGCFVAMMSVGDDELLVSHLRLHGLNDVRVRDLPHPVQHIVFIADFNRRRPRSAAERRRSPPLDRCTA